MTDTQKIIGAAVATSLLTACVTEPLKAFVQRRVRRGELRRAIYWELANNTSHLVQQVAMAATTDEMKKGIGYRFERWGYGRVMYDRALKEDAYIFYGFRSSELSWFRTVYDSFQSVVSGYDNEETCLAHAQYAVDSLVSYLKNRQLSKRMMFKVSPSWLRAYFRSHLPSARYIDIQPPKFLERLRRRYDNRIWRAFPGVYQKG